MRIIILIFLTLHTPLSNLLKSQNCIEFAQTPLPACLAVVEIQDSHIKELKLSPENSLALLFYNYFTVADYAGYKQLFLVTDWYGLSSEDFITWRSFTQNADLNMLGYAVVRSGSSELGIVKYTYVMDDMLMYETFLAKKAGEVWRPASVRDEQNFAFFSGFIKHTNLSYLQTLLSNAGRNPDFTAPPDVVANNAIKPTSMMRSMDSLQVFDTVAYHERFNPEFVYRTSTKYDEDRTRDATFVTYLSEMQLAQEEIDVVLKYIQVHEYLHAAQKADDFSDLSYTYAPFVDKIREIYGKDRIKKWDPVNKKWD